DILGTALAASENHLTRASDPTRLPGVALEKLLASSAKGVNLELFFCPEGAFSINVVEALALASLVRLAGAKRAFEFGTYRGISSSQIALNLAATGKLFTLDLPANHAGLKFDLKEPDEKRIAAEKVKGDLIPAELLPRVEFLHADSAAFDETPYRDSMD